MKSGKRIGNEKRRDVINTVYPNITRTMESRHRENIDFYPLHSDLENDESKHSLKIGFLIIATGKYDIFVEPLIRSIEKFFLPKNKKIYNIFTD